MSNRRRGHEDDETNYGKRLRRDTSGSLLEVIHHRLDDLGNHRGNSVELRLENLALFLSDKLDNYKRGILSTLMKSIQQHPKQSSGFATLIGLINVKRFQFGGEAIQYTMVHLEEQMRLGCWDKARCLLWFLAGLVNANVVTAGSYLQLLTLLMKECEVELEVTNKNQLKVENDESEPGTVAAPQQQQETWLHRHHDWLTYTVLSTLPLVGRELYEKREAGLNALLLSIQVYVKKSTYRRNLNGSLLRVWSRSDPMQLECLDVMWYQIDQLHSDGWIDKYYLVSRPYLAFDNVLSGALNHVLPAFKPPEPQPSNTATPPPNSWIVFRIFDFQDSGAMELDQILPEVFSIDRYLIDGEIHEIFRLTHLDRNLCADQLIEYAESKPDLAISHCIVEFLLGKILQLPLDLMDPKMLAINCGAVLIELCKRQPTNIGCIISDAVDILYRQLETMNVACFDRFVNWFSHHLSNFRFEWNWSLWESNLNLLSYTNENLMLHPTAVFLRELLKKLVRFSYYHNVAREIPETFVPFMSPSPVPEFKYVDELLPASQLATQFLQAMRNKCAPDMIINILTGNKSLNTLFKIEILMYCICHLGSKSFSHSFAMFNKFKTQLKSLAISEDEQHSMLAGICDIWKNNEQFKYVLIEKLLRMRIIDAKCIVSWFFSPAQKMELTKMYVWEIIYVTVRFLKYPHRFSAPGETCNEEDAEKKLKIHLMDVINRFVKVLSLHQQTNKTAAVDEEQEKEEHVQMEQEQVQKKKKQQEMQEEAQIEQAEQSQQKERDAQMEQNGQKKQVEQGQEKEQKQDLKEKQDYWFNWILGRFQEFLIAHMFEFRKLRDRLNIAAVEAEYCKGVSKIIYTFLFLNT